MTFIDDHCDILCRIGLACNSLDRCKIAHDYLLGDEFHQMSALSILGIAAGELRKSQESLDHLKKA
ncbi:hypothetical protein [Lyngbya aestuarii]|uniref:hypothetical protein n=1 Tax=Lyngbya aestuarii TaxID=118322 RepID=UPI00403DF5AA